VSISYRGLAHIVSAQTALSACERAIQLTHHGFGQLQLDGLLLQAMTPRAKR
jgi:hypothetical protein